MWSTLELLDITDIGTGTQFKLTTIRECPCCFGSTGSNRMLGISPLACSVSSVVEGTVYEVVMRYDYEVLICMPD